MWLVYSLVGYTLLAFVFILDKRILSKNHTSPAVFAFYSTIFLLAVGLVWLFGVPLLSNTRDWLLALVSGFTFGLGLLLMYKAVEKNEASHMDPFIGAVITIATFAAASFWLNETLNRNQIIGMCILAGASLILSHERRRKGKVGLHVGYLWGIAAGIAFALSNVSTKYLYDLYPFLTAFVATRVTIGVFGLILLPLPAVLKTFRKKTLTKSKTTERSQTFWLVLVDKFLGIIGAILIQFATATGSVTMVNALGGLQYALMFTVIIMLSKFRPDIFKESFTKRELIIQTTAIILVVLGLALVVA